MTRRYMTPSDIEVLIHCHTTPTEHPRRDAPAVSAALHRFQERGLIEWRSDWQCFVTTEFGKAYVDMLCATPEPAHIYVDPRELAE